MSFCVIKCGELNRSECEKYKYSVLRDFSCQYCYRKSYLGHCLASDCISDSNLSKKNALHAGGNG